MAQTNFTPISLYYSATATNVPTAGNLVAGELAINTADGKLFYKDSAGVVQTIATKNATAGTYSSITTNQLTIGTTQLGAGDSSMLKNRIINGAMVIDQRNAGAAVTTSSAFPVDRFFVFNSTDGAFSAQQDSSTPTGFVNSLKYTTTTADGTLTTDQNTAVLQRIEGTNIADLAWGTANAKTVTLSFWVRSSLTGTFGGALRNSAQNRSYPFSYTISVADTWEYKTITVAGDTSGTWLTTNGTGIQLSFSLGAGPNRSGTAGAWTGSNVAAPTGAVSVIGTLNATWFVTGVQLEVGTQATGFEYRQYGQELGLCQRYFEKTYNIDVAPTTNTSAGIYDLSGSSDSGGNLIIRVNFAVSKRANPTVTLYTSSGSSGIWNYNRNGASGTGVGTVDNIGMSGVRVYIAIGANWVVGGVGGHWVASAEL
jgi:hypothetical protein